MILANLVEKCPRPLPLPLVPLLAGRGPDRKGLVWPDDDAGLFLFSPVNISEDFFLVFEDFCNTSSNFSPMSNLFSSQCKISAWSFKRSVTWEEFSMSSDRIFNRLWYSIRWKAWEASRIVCSNRLKIEWKVELASSSPSSTSTLSSSNRAQSFNVWDLLFSSSVS